MNNFFEKILRVIYPHKNPVVIKREYNLPDALNLRIELTQDGYFVATCPELPGLVTEANSYQELVEMVNDAVLTYFDVPRKEADIIYDTFNLGGKVIQYEGKLQTKLA